MAGLDEDQGADEASVMPLADLSGLCPPPQFKKEVGADARMPTGDIEVMDENLSYVAGGPESSQAHVSAMQDRTEKISEKTLDRRM